MSSQSTSTTVTSAATVAANMRKTTEALLHELDGQWQPEATQTLRAPECMHKIYPASLKFEAQSNEEFLEFFTNIAPLVSDAKMTLNDYFASVDDRRAMVRSSVKATTPAGPFANEYVFIMWFDESGTKLTKVDEFMDSVAATGMQKALGLA